ncbi:MAG: hypothetical protein U0232_28445 [Thermomicrobiales bacterium]
MTAARKGRCQIGQRGPSGRAPGRSEVGPGVGEFVDGGFVLDAFEDDAARFGAVPAAAADRLAEVFDFEGDGAERCALRR